MNAPTSPTPSPSIPPWLKLGLDLGPLVAFFATYKFADIFVATGVLMAATVLTLGIGYFLTKKIAIIPLVTGVMVMIFGGLTIYLNSELFIKLKLTIIYVLLAGGMYVGLYMGKPFAKVMMEMAIELPEWCWRTLTYRFAALFLAVAGMNEIARQVLTTDDWVTFKVIGVPVLMFAFMFANMPFVLRNEIGERDSKDGAKATSRDAKEAAMASEQPSRQQ